MARPPRPVVMALITCRRVIEDTATKEKMLIAPWGNLLIHAFPHTEPTGIYVEYASGHGDYMPSFQLRDLEDEVVWVSKPYDKPINMPDPLKRGALGFFAVPIRFPGPGKYDLVWLLNGEEVARRALHVDYPESTRAR